jgi:tRNA-dihydrouridine synthase 3
MRERDAEDGRKELVLLGNLRNGGSGDVQSSATQDTDVVNVISAQDKIDLTKRKTMTAKAEAYTKWLDKAGQEANARSRSKMQPTDAEGTTVDMENGSAADAQDMRAQYAEPPFLPSEKRRIYFGAETPVLAPLTTQGNLPFRRLCVSMGAQITYSEMAMSFPLIQGQKSEWALMKAHRSETSPPRFRPSSVVAEYDNAKDFRFGAQIAGNRPDQTLKATEILTRLCPHLRVIDLNCGCPIDLVWRQGAGSALLDSQAKLEKMLRGMNAVSEAIPITAKIRMGTKDGRPTALKLINRLVYGAGDPSDDHGDPCGIAALTLHGRSRQQRYAKSANWEYISECAALIKRHGEQGHALADTIREAEARHQPAQSKVYFVGNGDCFSHVDYDAHIRHAGVDSVMIARGALIKPWIFEEIEKRQYLDKSATERLAMVEQFVRHGLEAWGSDEMGVGTTRRFLLEWLSFAYRYVPVGIMEHLPPSLQDRPPAWRGRNELEGLLGSDDYRDWIKIR